MRLAFGRGRPVNVAIEQGVYLGGLRGIGTYVKNLVRELAMLDSEDRFLLFGFFFRDFESKAAQIYRPRAANFEPALRRWPESVVTRLEWKWGLPVIDAGFCRANGVDVYHSPGIRLPKLGRAAGVMTVHDLVPEIYPGALPAAARAEWSAFSRRQVERADLVMVDSERTKQDLLERFGTPDEKVRVVYLGIDHEAFVPLRDPEAAAALRRKFSLPERYLVSVGPWEERRNLETELEALRRFVAAPETADVGLVLVGTAAGAYADGLRRRVAELGLSERVRWTGYVTQPELAGLYSLAAAFVYPSWYDGYNMPMHEAMGCGAPVLVSSAGALPELGRDAALYFDPADADAMADAMRRILTDSALAAGLREKGFRRTLDFQWDKTARECLDVYRQAAQAR